MGLTTDSANSAVLGGTVQFKTFDVDTSLYGRDALFQTCYRFTDRCYLFLRRAEGSADVVTVEFRARTESGDLEAVLGEFANELLDQRLRADIARDTRAIRELIVTQAFHESRTDGR